MKDLSLWPVKKYLIIRFSSIGDIVLTSPIIRCLKQQVPDAEIHFLSRTNFKPVLEHNPYIDKLWLTDGTLKDVLPELKEIKFDAVIDLHHNLRTMRVKNAIKAPAFSFSKLNIEKWLIVNLKISKLPDIHIVDRYFKTVEHLGVKNNRKGLDYFTGEGDIVSGENLPITHRDGFVAVVIGAKHATKMLPVEKIVDIIKLLNAPVILFGGLEDAIRSTEIKNAIGDKVFDVCGKLKLNQSAALLKQAKVVITHDTGLMHIAAAFHKPIISVWGNTIPEFGMYPYMPGEENKSVIFEIKNLYCRPCSKIGYDKCPKGHFRCMMEQDVVKISAAANRFIK